MKPRRLHRSQTGCLFAAALCLGLPAHAQAPAAAQFIQGAWVAVAASAEAKSRPHDALPANTAVTLLARQGQRCQIQYGQAKTGFVDCRELGPQALRLEQLGADPARAFWVAPSPKRLAAYGQSLKPPAALRLEVLQRSMQPDMEVRYPARPEFDAAKQRMQAGVLLSPAQELPAREPVDMAKELKALTLRPASIRPSWFRDAHSVALISEADADGLAAVAGSRVRLLPTGLPKTWSARHNWPEIDGVSGFWDVGSAALKFSPTLPIYAVAANGLIGGVQVSSLPFNVGGEGHYCGAHYKGNNLNMADALQPGASEEHLEFQFMRERPGLKPGTEVLARFALAQALPFKSAKIKTQSQTVQLPALEGERDPSELQRLLKLKPRAVLREIDLDGDGVADLMQLEQPLRYGEISLDLVMRRSWYLNIQGQWFKAGEWEDEDCT